MTVWGALSETVVTVSLSTVPRLSLLSRQSCCLVVCEWGSGWDARGRASDVANSTHHVFMRDQMTRYLDDCRCSACGSDGQFQETAPRKTAENTVKHCDGGVGLVVSNHRDGSVVITTLVEHNTLDLRSTGYGFKSYSGQKPCNNLGKLFTPM